MGEWKEYVLEDCMDAIIDYRGKTPKKTSSGVPLITAKIIKNGSILPTQEYIAEADYDSWMRRGIPKIGDVLLTTEAPLGEVAQISDPNIALAQRVITLRGKKNFLNNDFLKYLLISPQSQAELSGRSSGTTVLGIKQSELRKIKLRIPEYQQQEKIAVILKSLDDKIELNRKMSETLEEMARAIFKSWFVDFDPVHAKARGEKPAGMPDEIADLFPSEFVHSDQLNKPIPKGWEVKPLGEVFESFGGGTPSTKEPEYWVDGIYYWATPKDLSNLNEPIVFNTERKLTEKGLNKVGSGLLPQGTVLLSSRAPIGYIAISETPIAINQGFIAIKENKFFSKYFIYFWCKENIEIIIANANGSTFLEISKKNFRNINSVFPVDEKIISAFTSIVEPIFQLIQKNIIEKNTLTELRDSLLPKLISGEIEV